MIDFDHIKDYLPVGRTKNKFLFVFLKEYMLMGQKLSDKKTVFAVNVVFLTPSQISYRKGYHKGILHLAPSKFLQLLQPLGYNKDEYIFITEIVTELPETFEQVLSDELFAEVQGAEFGVVQRRKKNVKS